MGQLCRGRMADRVCRGACSCWQGRPGRDVQGDGHLPGVRGGVAAAERARAQRQRQRAAGSHQLAGPEPATVVRPVPGAPAQTPRSLLLLCIWAQVVPGGWPAATFACPASGRFVTLFACSAAANSSWGRVWHSSCQLARASRLSNNAHSCGQAHCAPVR